MNSDMFFHFVCVFSSLLLFFPFPARAQNTPDDVFFRELPTVITPARIPKQPWRAPASVEVYDARTIREWGIHTVADLLRRVAGMDIRQQGPNHLVGPRGSATTSHIYNVLILLNGIPVNDPLLGAFDLGLDFPVELIRQLEIVKGPGSSLYGANAYAGVINIITKKAFDVPGTELHATGGHHGMGAISVLRGIPSIKYDLLMGLRTYQTDARDGNVINDNDAFQDFDLFTSFDKDKWSTLLYGSTLRQGRSGNELDPTEHDYVENENIYVHTRYQIEDKADGGLAIDLYGNSKDGSYSGHGVPGRPKRVDFTTDRIGANLRLTKIVSLDRTIVAGLEFAEKRADWLDLGGSHSSRECALYFHEERHLPSSWTLTLGARLDNDSTFGTNFSPRVTALRDMGHRRTLRLSFGTAYRAPNFSEQYIDTIIGSEEIMGFVIPIRAQGNRFLDPEIIYSYEIGISHNMTRRTRADLNLYYNRIKDRIASELTLPALPPGPGAEILAEPVNRGSSIAYGFELTLRSNYRNGSLQTNYTWQRAYDRETEDTLQYAPKSKFNLNLTQELGNGWSAFLGLRYVSARRFEFGYHLDDYTTVDLRLNYRIDKTRTISLQGFNIFDEDYCESNRYPMRGSTVFIEFRQTF